MPVDQLFGDTYNPYEMEQFQQYDEYEGETATTDRTMKNFYRDISYGKVNISREVAHVKMAHPYSYYKIGKKVRYRSERIRGCVVALTARWTFPNMCPMSSSPMKGWGLNGTWIPG